MTEPDESLAGGVPTGEGGASDDPLLDDPLSDDALTGDFRVWQRVRGHRYSLDDVLTAREALDAVAGQTVRRVCDLGCGIGSVLLTVAWARRDAALVGIEAQDVSLALARRNVARNHLDARVRLIRGDLRDAGALAAARGEFHGTLRDPDALEAARGNIHGDLRDDLRDADALEAARGDVHRDRRDADARETAGGERRDGGLFDLVTGTPPYVPPGKSTPSPDPQKAHARVELRGGIEDYLAAAASLVAPEGVVVICGDARFPARAFDGARAAGLHVRGQRDAVPRAGRVPLFSVWTFTRAPGAFETATPFVARDADGRRTPEYLALRASFGLPRAEAT